MSRISDTFHRLQSVKEKAFIPFVTAGDPNLESTERIVLDLAKAGADIIEIGIPYSDPLADGPTIQGAAVRALSQGVNIRNVFETVQRIRLKTEIPLVMFTYVNPIFQYGIEAFFQKLVEIGADGVIIPDLPIEESVEALAAAKKYEIDLIPLVAPTSEDRIHKICQQAMGFVYCVSSLGVTGVRDRLPDGLQEFVSRVREATDLPIAVGFGVGTPDMAREIAKVADGVIVGSAIVQKVALLADSVKRGDQREANKLHEELSDFAASLKAPLRSVK